MPLASRSNGGRREVRREGHDVAQVLGRRDDLDPFVVGDRHEVVVDEVLASSQHRLAVGGQRAVEIGRVVGLDAIDDLGLGGVGVDLAGGGRPGGLLALELLPAEGEDLVRVEAVEGAQGDHRVVPLAADRPVVGAVGEGPLEPRPVQLDRHVRGVGGALQPSALGRRQDAIGARPDLGQEPRQLGGGLQLDAAATAGPAVRPGACAPHRGRPGPPRADR